MEHNKFLKKMEAMLVALIHKNGLEVEFRTTDN